MKGVWKKIRDGWLDFWDDGPDAGKRHLGRQDRRSLLYGCFMTGAITTVLVSIGTVWAEHRRWNDMEEFLGMAFTYLATATDEEYEDIARAIRHDLVYSEYGQEIGNLIRYIPNTADGCCMERDFPERVNLVFLNTGEAYGMGITDDVRMPEIQEGSGGIRTTYGYDEISKARILISSGPDTDRATVSIDCGLGIVSAHKMKTHFCDGCIREILAAAEVGIIDEAVIYDAEEKTFYPVSEGDFNIGAYSLLANQEEGGCTIEIEYTGE